MPEGSSKDEDAGYLLTYVHDDATNTQRARHRRRVRCPQGSGRPHRDAPAGAVRLPRHLGPGLTLRTRDSRTRPCRGRFVCDNRSMRADRLVAILLLLQSRTQVTAAEVAAELEISERTARRDLDALSMAGVPVYSKQGRNGGWQLVGGAKTDLSGLTAAEARALFLVAGTASSTPEVKAALRKLVRALPEPFRTGAEAASNAVVVDPTALGQAPEHPRGARAPRGAAARRRRGRAGRARLRRAEQGAARRASCTRSASRPRDRSGTSSATPTRGCERSASSG